MTTCTFSGPSQIGKDALLLSLARDLRLTVRVNATTRRPRVGEVPGRDYIFLAKNEFQQCVRRHEFEDWDYTAGHYYGIIPSTGQGASLMHCLARMAIRRQVEDSSYAALLLLPRNRSEHIRRIHATFEPSEARLREAMLQEEFDHRELFQNVVEVDSFATSSEAYSEITRWVRHGLGL